MQHLGVLSTVCGWAGRAWTREKGRRRGGMGVGVGGGREREMSLCREVKENQTWVEEGRRRDGRGVGGGGMGGGVCGKEG